MKIKVLIATHLKAQFPKSDLFMPIHVGKALSDIDLGISGDNSGDNISEKNPYYSEMTAHYWAWKNLKDLDYVGVCHYRRYFDIIGKSNFPNVSSRLLIKNLILKLFGKCLIVFRPYTNLSIKWIRRISVHELDSYIMRIQQQLMQQLSSGNYDILYMKPFYSYNRTVKESFFIGGYYYYEQLNNIITEEYQEYKPFYNKVMDGHEISTNNMHIMKWNVYDEYCSFIFGVLEKHLAQNKEEGDSYLRVVAYMSEILTTVFLFKKKQEGNLKMKEMSHIYIEEYFVGRKSPLG